MGIPGRSPWMFPSLARPVPQGVFGSTVEQELSRSIRADQDSTLTGDQHRWASEPPWSTEAPTRIPQTARFLWVERARAPWMSILTRQLRALAMDQGAQALSSSQAAGRFQSLAVLHPPF